MNLDWKYRSGSTLPKRTFLVSVQYNWTEYETYQVTAPDYCTGEFMVRRLLDNLPGVSTFTVEMVREVAGVYDPDRAWATRPCVAVPTEYAARAVVGNPYFGY